MVGFNRFVETFLSSFVNLPLFYQGLVGIACDISWYPNQHWLRSHSVTFLGYYSEISSSIYSFSCQVLKLKYLSDLEFIELPTKIYLVWFNQHLFFPIALPFIGSASALGPSLCKTSLNPLLIDLRTFEVAIQTFSKIGRRTSWQTNQKPDIVCKCHFF